MISWCINISTSQQEIAVKYSHVKSVKKCCRLSPSFVVTGCFTLERSTSGALLKWALFRYISLHVCLPPSFKYRLCIVLSTVDGECLRLSVGLKKMILRNPIDSLGDNCFITFLYSVCVQSSPSIHYLLLTVLFTIVMCSIYRIVDMLTLLNNTCQDT